jgi:hypothetical protein
VATASDEADGAADKAARMAAEKAILKAEKAERKAARAERGESRLILGLKWLAKLMLSAVFLVWIFFLGVMVGRGTLLNSSAEPAPEAAPVLADQEPGTAADASASSISPYSGTDPAPMPSPYGGEPVFPEEADAEDLYAYIPPDEADPGYVSPAPGIPSDYQAYPPAAPRSGAASAAGPATDGENGRTGGPAPPAPASAIPHVPQTLPASASASAGSPAPSAKPAASPVKPAASAASPARDAEPDPVVALQARRSREAGVADSVSPTLAQAAKPQDDTVYWPGPPKGKGQYTVQVASPTSEQEARTVAERYRKQGFDAYYYATGKGRFPTRVGRFRTAKDADDAQKKLVAAGAKGPYVSKLNS